MKDSAYYGPYSVAVATCGSQLNRFQINLLIQKLGVNEIILALDKEYLNLKELDTLVIDARSFLDMYNALKYNKSIHFF